MSLVFSWLARLEKDVVPQHRVASVNCALEREKIRFSSIVSVLLAVVIAQFRVQHKYTNLSIDFINISLSNLKH